MGGNFFFQEIRHHHKYRPPSGRPFIIYRCKKNVQLLLTIELRFLSVISLKITTLLGEYALTLEYLNQSKKATIKFKTFYGDQI